MSYPARDNQITFGAVAAWLLVLALVVVVLFLIFKSESGPTQIREVTWATEDYETPGYDLPKEPLILLSNTEWLLIELTIDGEPYELSDEVTSIFRCDENARFSGNTGCNNYFGQLKYDPDDKTISLAPIGTTMMACPPPKDQHEIVYLRALDQATRLEMGGHHLRLSSSDDNTVLTYALIIPEGTGQIETPIEQGNIDVDAQSTAGGKTARASMIYRGTLRLVGKQLEFRPCNGDFTVQLEDSRFNLDVVANQVGLNLDAGVYAEFRATMQRHDEEGCRLQLRDPFFMANEGGSCERPTPVGSLVSSGNEPFWTLIVGEQHTTLKTPEGEWRLSGTMHPDDAFFNSPGGERSATFENAEESVEVSARFEKNPCRDSMVDAWSAYSAQVTINGVQGKGCARPGRYLPPAMGRYGATLPAASSPGRRLELMLYDSGHATLTTDFQNEKPVINQQGIWQQRDASTVEIQFMTLNQKPVRDRMVFTSDGNSLLAVEFDPQHWGDKGLRLARIMDQNK